MRKKLPKILVTGGAGFIGSAFVRLIIRQGYRPVVIDRLTYAGDLARLKEAAGKYELYKIDIRNRAGLLRLFTKAKPEIVVNFAAETHVDRSINNSAIFIETNLNGTQNLLDASREYGVGKFIQISTDECYGDIVNGSFTENSALKPNSPYSASKACADLLIKSYVRTYEFPAIIVRPCNNYGPWQYPEKLIPLSVLKVLRNEKVPVYGNGRNVREWIYVDDCAKGIWEVLNKGRLGEVYNLGSGREEENISIVKMLLKIVKKDNGMIQFVKDRPGHDIRYSLDSRKVFKDTGWRAKVGLTQGLNATVSWCMEHKGWLLSKWADIRPLYIKR